MGLAADATDQHSSSVCPFEPLSRWLQNKSQSWLNKYKHLAFSTRGVLKTINEKAFSKDCKLVHVDVG